MMLRFVIAACASLLMASPSFAQSLEWKVDPAHTNVQFSIRHMMISNVRGEFGKVAGTVNFDGKDATEAKVKASVDVGSINTREDKRDDHLRGPDFFDTEKFPSMTFASKKIEKSPDGKLKMTGDLTLHGVTKEVVLDVEPPTPVVKDPFGNERVGASATGKINRKDFGLTWSKPLETGGVLVGDDVAITIDVELMRKIQPATNSDKTKKSDDG